jgi:anaerobic selenocysteine-containing dehydrogenase
MGANANVTEWFAAALMLVTGSLDQPGGMWCNPGLLARLDKAGIDARKSKPAQPGPPSRPELPRRFGQYPCAAMVDEIEAGNLRALLCLAGNPLVAFAEPDRLRRAFETLNVLAVADIRETATVAVATHVLPCAGAFERPDATIGAELYQPIVAAHYVPAVVEPVAGRRSMWWILAQLGERLGHRVLPDDLEPDVASDDDMLDALGGAEWMAALRAAPSGLVASVSRFGWILGLENRPPFDLAPAELVNELDRLVAPAPLVLLPRRQIRHINSWFAPEHLRQDALTVQMHPDDATDVDASDGEHVRVTSASGSLQGMLEINDTIARGAVSIPHGFGGHALGVGELISSTVDIDLLTGMTRQSGVPVQVERLLH